MRIVARFGSTAIAGYGVAMRVVLFALLPSWGMANAAATLVGQNLGAGRPERAEQAVWRAALYNLVFLGCMGLLFVLFGEPIVRGVHVRPGGRRLRDAGAAHHQRRVPVLRLRHGADPGVQRRGRHAGRRRCINLFCFWLWEIPLAWLLAGPLGLGPTGVFIVGAGRLLHHGAGERGALPPRPLEARPGVASGAVTATASDTNRAIETVFRIESPRLIAGLARIVRDVGLAEELAQEALVAALEKWPESGVPDNPGAWLMATAKNRAIDELRRGQAARAEARGAGARPGRRASGRRDRRRGRDRR